MVTNTQSYILGALATIAVVTIFVTYNYKCNKKSEDFTADGLVYNRFPNWMFKQTYDPNQWLVRQYVDTIQPECLSYSKASKYGSLENVNYMASATRFWRM
jgi:hypothetical protein